MRRSLTTWTPVAVALALAFAGCSSLMLLHHGSGGRPKSHADQIYLAKLSAEQARLAADELRLPRHPKTPAALSHSIRALARTVGQFGTGLAAITAPGSVAPLHRRLVDVERRYAEQLAALAGRAGRPAQEVAAANELVADTNAASDEFTATFVQIHARLVH